MAKPISIVGVDIGANTIKVAELRYNRGKPLLTAFGIAPTPSGAVSHSGIQDPVGVGNVLKRLLVDAGVTAKQAVFGISGQSSVVVRVLPVDKMSDSELKKHMEWEIQRSIPFADTQIISDFAQIYKPNASPDDKMVDVIVAVSPQDAIDRLLSVGRIAGLSAYGIDVESLSIGRVLISSQVERYSDKTICVVGIGDLSTSIDIFENGVLSFPRILPMGGSMLLDAIKANLGATDEESIQYLHEYGKALLDHVSQGNNVPDFLSSIQGEADFQAPSTQSNDEPMLMLGNEDTYAKPSNTVDLSSTDYRQAYGLDDDIAIPNALPGYEAQDAPSMGYDTVQDTSSGTPPPMTEDEQYQYNVSMAIAHDIEELVAEIRRSLDYYRSRSNDTVIDQILLCGGVAKLPDLDNYIQAAIGIPVVTADPVHGIQPAMRKQTDEELMRNALVLPIAIGLAMNAWDDEMEASWRSSVSQRNKPVGAKK